ncbi:MAG: histidine phosphatase family protein [Bacteroidota bacterium]
MNKNSKLSKTIHLIRHGETDFNKLGIIQGSGVNSELNEKGRHQARLFYEAYHNTPYEKVYTSVLKRAIQSVEGFIEQGVPHIQHTGLNEINWGVMEGAESSEYNRKVYFDTVRQWSEGHLDVAVANGESPLALFERQQVALEEIMQASDELILICMHGRAMRSFLCLLTGTPLKEMEQWEHTNLCLYELVYNGQFFEITKNCDVSHLVL